MSIVKYKPGLELSPSLLTYLSRLTTSWVRQQVIVTKSPNGEAFWNGQKIFIPDLRFSETFSYLLDFPINFQFSFYSALTFHEAMHAKCASHEADTYDLEGLPEQRGSLGFFIYNLLEDGKIERIGLLKRKGSLIYSQLYRLNSYSNDHNWVIFDKFNFSTENECFIAHFLNQLFTIIKLGTNFLRTSTTEEKEILNQVLDVLPAVFKNPNPNSAVNGAISILDFLTEYFDENDSMSYAESLNEQFYRRTESIIEYEEDHDWDENQIQKTSFQFKFRAKGLDELIYNMFNRNEDKNFERNDEETDAQSSSGKQEKRTRKFDSSNGSKTGIAGKGSTKGKGKENGIYSGKNSNPFWYRPRLSNPLNRISSRREYEEYKNFTRRLHIGRAPYKTYIPEDDDFTSDYFDFDVFDNDCVINTEKTKWNNCKDLDEYIDVDLDEFNFDQLFKTAQATAYQFLKLAGIDIKKKNSGKERTHKIPIRGQKHGILDLTGHNLSQLLAGNQFIRKKDLPAKLKIDIDLVILVDLTGSMQVETRCDDRIGTRMEFANEATIVLALFLHKLTEDYHLPINFSIIGYSVDYSDNPTLQILKRFEDPYQTKRHSQAIYSWNPDGENCDARAIFEATNLLDMRNSKSNNKTIFFLSDGGGEANDYPVLEKIFEEFPNFERRGPKDFTDCIRYAKMKKISVYVFVMEAIDDKEHLNSSILEEFRRYYGENINIIGKISELIDSFAQNLHDIFKIRK